MRLVKNQFVVKTDDKSYYVEEVEVYMTLPPLRRKIIESTDDANEAARFDTFESASDVAKKYKFEVVAINTYIEE